MAFKRAPSLLLKSMPPRATRGFLDRERLQLGRIEASGAQVIALLAPAGFGKTAQLNHWRREVLARGGLAFWLTVDSNDEPLSLVRGLAFSAQLSCGKHGFDEHFLQWIDDCSDPREAITGWLAEVANLAVEVVLLLDEVDRLPMPSRNEILTYLLNNAPANLQVALAARPAGALVASGALRMARMVRLTASDLRFRLDETLAVLSSVLKGGEDLDTAAALHDLTEGWPFGIQLVAAALHRSGDLEGLIGAATADIRHYFIDTVINSQSADAVHMMERLAGFDLIHPDLCLAVLDKAELVDELLRIQDETPLLSQVEGNEWMRLHPLAHEVLRERWIQLPLAERKLIAQKASAWYAANELYEEAAQQAFLAGDVTKAFDLVERSTYQMTVQGKSVTVLSWYRRLPEEELHQHPGFWAPTAWALAMSQYNGEAQVLVDLILAQPGIAPGEKFEAALIEMTAAGFSDRVGDISERLDRWPEPPSGARPNQVPIYFVSTSFVALYRGQPEQARLTLAQIDSLDQEVVYSPVSYGLADYALGLSYLWEGRYILAEQVLRSALARAEGRLGRLNPVTCMLAALLARACWDAGREDEPSALLAGRLVALERNGLPDALLAAYRVLARVAVREGRQDQALNLLESLCAIGQGRAILRFQILAKFELVRLHAQHGRAESALALSRGLDQLIRDCRAHIPVPFIPWADLHADLARAHAMLAHQDEASLVTALTAAESAIRLAEGLKRGGEETEARLLQAEACRRQGGSDAHRLRLEAVSLARANGMLRLLQELHPTREHEPEVELERSRRDQAQSSTADKSHVRGTALLTVKEREVLALLNRNMSNKEIARAMEVGEETIKWHMKNLFSKLNAANRKHVVARARMLGLID